MPVQFDSENAVWGDLISIVNEEPYIYMDGLFIWEGENREKVLLKPFPEFNIRMDVEYIYYWQKSKKIV